MGRRVPLLILLGLVTLAQSDGQDVFEARQRALLRSAAAERDVRLFSVAARLGLREDLPRTFALFDSLARDSTAGGAFHGYVLMGTYLKFRNLLPDSLRKKVRESFRLHYTYRGDTENHWVMYYTGMYLAAQTWPGEDGTRWFNGRSSTENFEEAEGFLNHWMRLTTTVGQGEFDSPTYMPVFLTPMLVLYEFAGDSLMRRRAQMMCDLLLADLAVEHLRGNYGGGHSRDYPADIINPLIAQTTRITWLYFGQPERQLWDDPDFAPRYRGSWESVFAGLSSYRIPEMIVRIATDRSRPYVHRERKRVRNVMRFGDELNPPAYKYTYMTADYVLGSLHGGILEPFQQHTWDVTFVSDRRYNTIFTVHPYHSSRQLGMFFPEELNVLSKDVDRYKVVYTNPDKWNSSSPFEQTFQHRNALIVLYRIAAGAQHPHIDGFFPGTLDSRTVDPTGWIFCRSGKTTVAFYPLQPYEWIPEGKNWRFRSPHLRNGAVVEVATVRDTAEYNGFVARVRSTVPVMSAEGEPLKVTYTTTAGDRMEFTYDGPRLLNGTPWDPATTRLYDGPFMSADVGSEVIELKYGGRTRVLDFRQGRIFER
jgi:hypothetical protein